MKLVIQRVNRGKVSVEGNVVGEIGHGLFILVGVSDDDREEISSQLAEKVSKLRIMADGEMKMNKSICEVGKDVLAVSQFTLFADTQKGNRPSFIKAGKPEHANKIYEHFVAQLKQYGLEVQTGSFGEYMKIDTELDGPVTIVIDETQ